MRWLLAAVAALSATTTAWPATDGELGAALGYSNNLDNSNETSRQGAPSGEFDLFVDTTRPLWSTADLFVTLDFAVQGWDYSL